MNAAGLLFMLLSWGVIIGLNLFCFHRLRQDAETASPASMDRQG